MWEGSREGEVYYAISGNLCTFSPSPPSLFFFSALARSQFPFPSGFFVTAAFLSSFGTKFLYVTTTTEEDGNAN